MTQLACRAVDAGEELALYDDAAANTGTQRNEHHVFAALAAAAPHLAQCRRVGVIGSLDREAAQVRERTCHIAAPAVEVHAGLDVAILQHGAGNAHTRAQDLVLLDALFVELAAERRCDVLQDRCAAIGGIGGDLPLIQQLALHAQKAQLDGSAAKVDTKYILFHR